jgi:hypothetical protein
MIRRINSIEEEMMEMVLLLLDNHQKVKLVIRSMSMVRLLLKVFQVTEVNLRLQV